MRDFRKLSVWQKGHELTLAVYQATDQFPQRELYGLTSQIRRSSASIPANIAEGAGREGDKEFARFIAVASGSACETEYHLLLAKDLGYLEEQKYEELDAQVQEIKRMLAGFIRRLRKANS